jgi:hypothetical protein
VFVALALALTLTYAEETGPKMAKTLGVDANTLFSGSKYGNLSADSQKSLKFMDDFKKYMTSVNPADLVSFEIAAGETMQFVERVTVVPSLFKAAYTSSSSDDSKITFTLFDSTGAVTFLKQNSKEAVALYSASVPGEYVFEFKNGNVSERRVNQCIVFCGGEDKLRSDDIEARSAGRGAEE